MVSLDLVDCFWLVKIETHLALSVVVFFFPPYAWSDNLYKRYKGQVSNRLISPPSHA